MKNHYNQKHAIMKAGNQKLRVIAFVVGFIIVLSGLSAAASVPESITKKYYDAECVTLGGDGSVFVFENGDHIVITAGKSIRLLPGIRIEAGTELKVEVAVTTPVVAPEEEVRGTVMDNPEFLKTDLTADASAIDALPGSEKLSATSSALYAVIPVQSSGSNYLLAVKKNNILTDGELYSSEKYRIGYMPVLSWGSRPENIKVLRT